MTTVLTILARTAVVFAAWLAVAVLVIVVVGSAIRRAS
jgi:hypothetical protein